MPKKKKPQYPIGIQLELFQSSKKLNLSETYEAIPKEVSLRDPALEWDNENIASPIEKPFSIEGAHFFSEITPALIKDRKTGKLKTIFPDNREARIEYAIISLASKQAIGVDTDKEDRKTFTLETTYYQIQKEIVEAINKQENRSLSPYDCPYNITSIKEALEVLKMTTIKVRNSDGENQYLFNRIKDMYFNNKRIVIELGNMITNYIDSGDWLATDRYSILSSKGKYERKLRVLLNLKFRYATQGSYYNPSLSYLVSYLDFIENKEKRITLQKVTKLIESLHEVKKIEVEKRYQGRKIIDAVFRIYPSENFISMMIENNKSNKRVKEALIENDGTPLIEPIESDFAHRSEYHKAKKTYDIKRGKLLLK